VANKNPEFRGQYPELDRNYLFDILTADFCLLLHAHPLPKTSTGKHFIEIGGAELEPLRNRV
jgi:hypothetical protein